MQHSEKFLGIVSDAKTRIKEIDLAEFKQIVNEKLPFNWIDVRDSAEGKKGAIPNAIHLSKGVLEMNIAKAVPDSDAMIIVYCGGGFRSALAADNLQKMGYTNVVSLAGGYHGWANS